MGGATAGAVGAGVLIGSSDHARIDSVTGPVVRVTLDSRNQDASGAIQAAIDSSPEGAYIQLPGGRHRLDRRITIQTRADLTIAGPAPSDPFEGWTTVTGLDLADYTPGANEETSERAHWRISASSGIRLANISVAGPNTERNGGHARYEPSLAFEAAFSIREGCQGTVLQDCSYQDVYGDGIYVGGVGTPNTETRIRNVAGSHSGRQGFAIVNALELRADDVSCDFTGLAGLDIEPNHETQFVRRVTLNRLMMGSRHFPFTIGGIDDEVRREDIELRNCSVIRCPSEHLAIRAPSKGRRLRILGHTDDRQPTERGMDVGAWTDVEVSGSVVTTTIRRRRSVAMLLRNCDGTLRITDNDFRGRSRGFDELVQATGSTDESTIQHSGNVWDMGEQRD